MEKYIAIVSHSDKKVTKYQDFASKSDADSHVDKYGGFVDEKPSEERTNYWIIDGDKKTISPDTSTAKADDDKKKATEYQRSRRNLYPHIVDFADAYYWEQKGDDSKMKAYVAACDKVKSDNPKP